jgi:hypothetical protein
VPTCEKCGGYVPRAARNCPTCTHMVDPTGTNPLVSDQRRPKNTGTSRNSARDYGRTFTYLAEFDPLDLELWNNLKSTKSEPIQAEIPKGPRPVDTHAGAASTNYRPRSLRGKVVLYIRPNRQAVFRFDGTIDCEPFESQPFLLNVDGTASKSEEARKALRALAMMLKFEGWIQQGRGPQWFELIFTRGSRTKPQPDPKSKPQAAPVTRTQSRQQTSAGRIPSIESEKSIGVERTVQLHVRPDGRGSFRMPDVDESRIRESKLFSLNFEQPESMRESAYAAHQNFISMLESEGWKRGETIGIWFELTMTKMQTKTTKKKKR